MDTIAAESHASKRYARTVVAQLEADGFLEVIPFTRRSNHYKLHLPTQGTIANPTDFAANERAPHSVEQGTESRHDVPESRLTYNSNQSIESVSVLSFSSFKNTEATLSQSLLTETGQRPKIL
jgi:hypothetical protein